MHIKRRKPLTHVVGDRYIHLPGNNHCHYCSVSDLIVSPDYLPYGQTVVQTHVSVGLWRAKLEYTFATKRVADSFVKDIMAIVQRINAEHDTLVSEDQRRFGMDTQSRPPLTA